MRKALLAAAVFLLPGIARADQIIAWDKIAQSVVRSERLKPEPAKQALSMVRAAVDDAVGAAAPMGGGASGDIAAAVAAHAVLIKLFPARKTSLDRRLDAVRVDLEDSVIELAAAEGRRAAAAVLASEWSWRRAVKRPTGRVKGPKVQELTLPLRRTSGEDLRPRTRADKL